MRIILKKILTPSLILSSFLLYTNDSLGDVETSENVYSMADTGKTGPSEDGTDAALTNDDVDGTSSKGSRKKPRR